MEKEKEVIKKKTNSKKITKEEKEKMLEETTGLTKEELDELKTEVENHSKKKNNKKVTKKETKKEKSPKKVTKKTEVKEEPKKAEVKDEPKKVEEKKVVTKKANKADDEDDIYLTQSFAPMIKKNNTRRLIAKILITVGIIGIIFYLGFIAYKKVYSLYLSKQPEAVFERTLNKLEDDLEKYYLSDELLDNFKLNVTLDTNYSKYKDYSGNYVFNYVNKGNNSYLAYQVDADHKLNLFNINDNQYLNFSTFKDYINISDDLDILKINKYLVGSYNISYYIKKNVSVIKDLIHEENLSKENTNIKIGNENVEVVKYTYELDKNEYEGVLKEYKKQVRDENVIELINDYIDLYDRDVESLKLNIYTDKELKSSFVGLDVEVNGFRKFYYYQNDDTYDVYYNYELVGTKDNMIIKNGEDKIGSIKFNTFEDDEIDLDYEVTYDDDEYEGTIKVLKEQNKVDVSFKAESGDKYFELDALIMKNNITIPDFVVSSINEYDEDKFNKEYDSFTKNIKNTELLEYIFDK